MSAGEALTWPRYPRLSRIPRPRHLPPGPGPLASPCGAGVVPAGGRRPVQRSSVALGENAVTLAITMFTLMSLAQAWNLLGGYGGQFSIGHGLFVGVGGYATTVVLVRTGLPVALSVLAAGLVCAAVGAVTAIPLLRLRGVYFSVGTIGVLLAVQSWFNRAGGLWARRPV